VTDQRHRFPGPDVQAEIRQDDFTPALLCRIGRVGEVHAAELDVPGQPRSRVACGLYYLRLRIDQGKHALCRGQPVLELAPKRCDADDRPPEEAHRLHEQVPVAGGNVRRRQGGQAAEIDQHGNAYPGRCTDDREDGVQRQPAAQHDAVRLDVVRGERGIDRALLPETLSDHDPAHRLLDLRVDLRGHAPRALRHGARDAAETQGKGDCDRRHDQEQECQPGVDGDEPHGQEQHQHDLAQEAGRQRYDLGQILRIRGDAADDLPRWMLVIERHVVPHGRSKHILANLQHHIAHDARGKPLLDEVEAPRHRAEQQHAQGQQGDGRGRWVARHQVDAGRDQDRPAAPCNGIQRDRGRDQHHSLAVRPEISENPAHQLAVTVIPVVCLVLEAVEDKTHQLHLAKMRQ